MNNKRVQHHYALVRTTAKPREISDEERQRVIRMARQYTNSPQEFIQSLDMLGLDITSESH